ncbi:MAG: MGMT family protein [Conexivisphaera sp.]
MPLIVVEEVEDGGRVREEVRPASIDDYAEALRALLLLLEPGDVTTYGELGRVMGISPRLVGRLLSRNPEAVIIPCHRVVSERGIGGYSSGGPRVKARLLELEAAGARPRLRRLAAELLGLSSRGGPAPGGRRSRTS